MYFAYIFNEMAQAARKIYDNSEILRQKYLLSVHSVSQTRGTTFMTKVFLFFLLWLRAILTVGLDHDFGETLGDEFVENHGELGKQIPIWLYWWVENFPTSLLHKFID